LSKKKIATDYPNAEQQRTKKHMVAGEKRETEDIMTLIKSQNPSFL
jgi:hypothetical protein